MVNKNFSKLSSSVQKNNKRQEDLYFNPYRLLDINKEVMDKGIPMIFVTTPMCNLKDENSRMDGFFSYMKTNRPNIYKMLSYSQSGKPFIIPLHNYFKSVSIMGTQTNSREVNETFYGYKQNLPSTIVNSISGGEINITYRDNKDLDVLSLHKMWLDYTEHVSRGTMVPDRTLRNRKMIDYVSSMYYFILDHDLKTILFFSKYTGLVPSNVPFDAMSGDIHSREIVEYSIDYLFSYKEDMNPEILHDFNSIALRAKSYASSNNNLDEIVDILGSGDRGKIDTKDYFVSEDHTKYTKPYITANSETGKYEMNFAKNNQNIPTNLI